MTFELLHEVVRLFKHKYIYKIRQELNEGLDKELGN